MISIIFGGTMFVSFIMVGITAPPIEEVPANTKDEAIEQVEATEEGSATEEVTLEVVTEGEQLSGDDIDSADREAIDAEDTSPDDTEDDVVLVQTETVSQKNATREAKSYLNYSAFSYGGLIYQLEYEGYSRADATYGADNSGADWYEQASKSAKAYMDYSAFSRSGLISQLKYEEFTQSQAEYGADAAGL
jgi:hypothetical protein